MFGRKSKLQQRLESGELQHVEAAVVNTHFLGSATPTTIGPGGPGHYRVRVQITTPGAEAFEASLNVDATNLGLVPHEGGTLPVAYDPDDHDAVIWDEQTARTAATDAHAFDRQRREQLAADRRAAGQPPIEQAGPDAELAARVAELQARHDRGEISDWELRTARAEIFKDAGF